MEPKSVMHNGRMWDRSVRIQRAMCSAMRDRCRTLIMEPESMSRLPFGIVWDSDLWTWLTGDLLRKPMYQLGLGHSTLIPPCELRLRKLQPDQHPKRLVPTVRSASLRHRKCQKSSRCDVSDGQAQTAECNLP